jgi:cytokinin riboside 5'-monophosphate phosphoribohydrolase
MMGAVAGRLVELGGKVHGIIPKALLRYEREGAGSETPSFGEMTVVGDMHTRKRLMANKSSAFIALPGGFGTMEELMEVCPFPWYTYIHRL